MGGRLWNSVPGPLQGGQVLFLSTHLHHHCWSEESRHSCSEEGHSQGEVRAGCVLLSIKKCLCITDITMATIVFYAIFRQKTHHSAFLLP